MLKFALIALVVVLAGILAYASTRPDTYHVERSVNIKAPAEKIFPFINDFRQWEAWTPFNKDPAMKKTYSGNASGKGASYAWDGNKEAGSGDITITNSAPPHKVVFDLHMITPFEGRNVGTISLDQAGDTTTVTWSVDDKHTLMLKVIGLLVDLDKKIGGDFEAGLAKLKSLAER
ncbi:MAG: Polyketide cyclase/dehydrase [Ramlibacter sp.]|nr:Polyketide cyclase/dehydrase [Ramlibacter sp.]